MKHVKVRVLAALSIVLLAVPLMSAQTGAKSTSTQGDGIGVPKFKAGPSVTNFSPDAKTIPYFRSTFTDPTNGVTYPYTMVGTDPAGAEKTTTIKTVIIPMRITFTTTADPANPTLDGTTKVAATVDSPVFQDADIGAAANSTASAPPSYPGVAPSPRVIAEPNDSTQIGDAIYRAQWGLTGSGYHVRLGQPAVLPTFSFTIPATKGVMLVGTSSGRHLGLVDYVFFSNRLNEAMRAYHVSPDTLPIFLVYNTFLYEGSVSNCCVLGYHGATQSRVGNGQQAVHTYMFAAYSDPGIFGRNPGDTISFIQDIHALSHEVQEWYDDPFVNNRVDPWLTPTAPQYGCSGLLETGDPVVGFGFEVTMANGITYHPEDEVHYSWFARESPSRADEGYYTYLNNFAHVAQGCH